MILKRLNMLVAAASLMFFGVASNAWAASTLRIDRIYTAGFPELRAYVDVLDSRGEPLLGLRETGFTVRVDDEQVVGLRCETFGQSGDGLAVILAIDASRTMDGRPLADAKSAVIEYIADIRSADRVAVVAFHDEVEIVSEFSGDKDLLTRRVEGIEAKGSVTELFRGISVGLDLARSEDLPGRRIALVLSDGKDEGREPDLYNEASCVEKALRANIPLYTIGFSRLTSDRDFYLNVLERLSDRTKGMYYFSPTSAKLSQFYSRTRHRLLNQYVLDFDVAEAGQDTVRNISVSTGTEGGQISDNLYVALPALPRPIWPYIVLGATILVLAAVSGTFISLWARSKRAAELMLHRPPSPPPPVPLPATNSPTQCPDCGRPLPSEGAVCPVCQDFATASGQPSSNKQPGRAPGPPDGASSAGRHTVVRSYDSSYRGVLRVESGDQMGSSVSLGDQEVLIGRDPSSDLVLTDPTVSASHARIVPTADGLQLMDRNSTNGTFVDGNRIHKAHLATTAAIRVGNIKLSFSGEVLSRLPKLGAPVGWDREATICKKPPTQEHE